MCLGVCRKWNTSKKRPRWCTCSSVSRKHHLLSVPSHVLTVTYTKQPRLKHVRCYKILHFHIDRCSYLLKRRLMSMPFMSICCSKEWRRWQSMEEKVCKTSILINATLGNQFVVIVHEELMCVWRNVKASAQSPFMPTVFFFQHPCSCSSSPPDVTLVADVTTSASQLHHISMEVATDAFIMFPFVIVLQKIVFCGNICCLFFRPGGKNKSHRGVQRRKERCLSSHRRCLQGSGFPSYTACSELRHAWGDRELW